MTLPYAESHSVQARGSEQLHVPGTSGRRNRDWAGLCERQTPLQSSPVHQKLSTEMDKAKPNLDEFWDLWTPIVDLLFPIGLAEKIRKTAQQDYLTIKDDINVAVSLTNFGKLAFEEAAKTVIAAEIEEAYRDP